MLNVLYARYLCVTAALCAAPVCDAQTPLAQPSGAFLARASEALDVGEYEAAEQLASAAYSPFGHEAAPSVSSLAALRLLVDAKVKNGKSADQETVVLAERAMSLVTRNAGVSVEDAAATSEAAASLYLERGEYSTALRLYETALAAWSTAGALSRPDVADSLDGIAAVLIQTQKFQDAAVRLNTSLELRKRTGAPPRAVARTLALVALVHRFEGEYEKALKEMDDVEALAEHALKNHPDLVAVHEIRGVILFVGFGNTAAAEAEFRKAIQIAEQTLRPNHPASIAPRRWLAAVTFAKGDLVATRTLLESSLPLAETTVAPCHQEFTAGLDDYANLLAGEGRYADAQDFYARSLTIRRKCLGPNHSLTATIIHNQAELARQMGDLVTAERLHQQATAIWARGLGPNHPYVARGLDALAEVAQAAGNLPKARALYERALAIRRKTGGPYHPDVAWTLTNLAGVLLSSGDRAAALLRVNEAIGIYQRGGAAQEPDHFARLVMLRGTVQLRSGDYAAAAASYDRALKLRADIFGTDHPLWAEAEIGTATARFALGSPEAALVSALEAERIGRDHLRFTDRYLPERQAMAYGAARPRGLDLALSIAAVDGSAKRAQVLDAVIRSRAVLLDELAARAQSATTNADPQLASLNRSLIAARQRFATLMLRSLQGEEVVPSRLLDEARQQKEDAERALAERSAAAREEAARAQSGLDDVRRSLPASSALVSFVRYERTSIVTQASRRVVATTPSYIALVARADKADVQVVPLGSASSIERLIDVWRSQVAGSTIAEGIAPREAERTYRAAAAALRVRVWDPLAEAISGVSRVFIVPDGPVNLVSFAALPMGNRYLLEAGPAIHYLSTERDLVRTNPVSGHGLLALGGPAFDVRVSNGPAAIRRSGGCATIGALRFEDLPGSRAEIQDIAKIWGNQNDVLMLSGRAATKTALTDSIVGRKVVHLATHGFFLGSGCEPTMPRTRGVGGVVTAKAVPTDNPLLLAGLALAGVNMLSRTNQANGILNAEEIAGLNLQGTEWAVLSACDTGLGQITVGEGVFGLRRALQIAGVRTIIMSLWSVEDRSTRDWMKALYEARLTKQLDTPDSVRAASLQVLDDRRKRGMSTHPFYWAAFVAAGDWR